MRCDNCPLCPDSYEYEADTCPIAESEYGMEHKDGILGCRHSWNWVKKKADEYAEHLAEEGRGMAMMMDAESRGFKEGYEKGKADAYHKILMYLNDASLTQSGKCYDCTRELMRIIEDMEAKDTDVPTKKEGGEK